MFSKVLRCFCRAAAILPLMTSGCSTTQHLPKAQVTAPNTWSKNVAADGKGVVLSSQPQPQEWWRLFHDPVLDSLVDRALTNCTDLKAAEARVREARAQRSVEVSDFFPHASVDGIAQRSRQSRVEMKELGIPGLLQPLKQNLFQAGFDASWEIDLFGGTRESVRAANARVDARLAEYSGVRISVAAETARNYFELRGAQTRHEVLSAMLASQKETVELLDRRRAAGTIADLEVTLSRGTVESTAAQIPASETSIQRAVTSLAVLLAESPDAVRDLLGEGSPSLTYSIPIMMGVPSEVLRARPDVRQAEHGIEAAAAAVGVSTAELFPKLNILGGSGVRGQEFADLGSMASHYWSAGPTIHWPILDIGRVLGNIRVQRARHEQALHAYEKTVLSALKDVEDAVVAYREAQKSLERLDEAVDQYSASLGMSKSLYQAGTKDYLYVLESERMLLAARGAKAVGDTTVATAAVGLCKALGGCWPEGSDAAKVDKDTHQERETSADTDKGKGQ